MNKSNRVLVVEDDAAIVRALSSFLTDEGFLCKSANGQTEALRLFEQEEFDIVLLDVSLADGSGFVVCSAMKSKKDIPIIFLTASVMNTALLRDLSSVRMTILQSLFGRGSLFRASKTLFDGRENRRLRSVSAMCVLTLREEPVSAGIRTFAFRHWNTGFC